MTPDRELFVNLAVRDLDASLAFFSRLGFAFDPIFSNDRCGCMQVGGRAWVMLLARPFFETFTDRAPCDTRTHTEAMLAVSASSRAEVDDLVRRAMALGGRPARDPVDRGFLYGWSFYDPDGHHWEVLWMDPERTPGVQA